MSQYTEYHARFFRPKPSPHVQWIRQGTVWLAFIGLLVLVARHMWEIGG